MVEGPHLKLDHWQLETESTIRNDQVGLLSREPRRSQFFSSNAPLFIVS
jgi:hypothetical protein